MIYAYNSAKVHYEIFHKGKSMPIFLLHGWGASGEIFKDFIKNFPEKTFITIDFPPFGKSEKDIKGWGIFTYVSLFMSLCEHLRIDECDILGHSFGGRIAIIVSAIKRSLVHSCILVDSAGMRPRRKPSYFIKIWKYKLLKRMGKDVSKKGSPDYRALSPAMKETFKNIIGTHLEDYAKNMKVKTLIVWGKEDKETPLYMAKRLNKLIGSSRLKIIEGAGHFPFIDRPFKFYEIFNEFMEDPWYI